MEMTKCHLAKEALGLRAVGSERIHKDTELKKWRREIEHILLPIVQDLTLWTDVHRGGAEGAEGGIFCLSGDDDKQKGSSSERIKDRFKQEFLPNRRLPIGQK